MKHAVHRFDQQVTRSVTTIFGQSTRPFFEFMTMLGDPLAISLVTIGIIGYGILASSVQVALTGTMIPATVVAGALLKMLFERARPMTEYAMNMRMKTFSFPSGHSSGSTITFGILAYLAFMLVPSPVGSIVGAILSSIPFFVGVSRVYLGAHFPSDVLAGWALGAAALTVVLFFIRPLT